MLMHYLERDYTKASPAEREAFERLLECPDPQLQEILMGWQPAPDPDMEVVAGKIRVGDSGYA